jgi:hypothetical protein
VFFCTSHGDAASTRRGSTTHTLSHCLRTRILCRRMEERYVMHKNRMRHLPKMWMYMWYLSKLLMLLALLVDDDTSLHSTMITRVSMRYFIRTLDIERRFSRVVPNSGGNYQQNIKDATEDMCRTMPKAAILGPIRMQSRIIILFVNTIQAQLQLNCPPMHIRSRFWLVAFSSGATVA